MRILALIPGGIGDQILFFPTLKDLKAKYPEATIDVMVEPRAKSAYRVCTWVQDVLTFNFKDRNGLADYMNLLGVIREKEYEVCLTLGRRWTVGLLLWLNGIPTRIGYETEPSWFLTNTVPLKTEQYAAHMYHDLLMGLGISEPCGKPEINVPKPDIDWAEGKQKSLGIKDTGYILIHGGSSQLAQTKGIDKIYPVEHWQKIITDIQTKQPDLPVVMIQGPEDAQLVTEIQVKCPQIKVVQPGDIGKLAAMIAGASLMLCTDSAPMHLSIAVGTYTIALFGPTEAKKLVPPDYDNCVAIQSPSGVIGDIKPEQVLEAIWRG